MTALHALEDHVIACLKRQVQMRHETLFLGDHPKQGLIGLDLVDRGQAQSRKIRHQFQDAAHEITQSRSAGKIRPPRGQIDAGQHNLTIASLGQSSDLIHHDTRRNRSRVAAPERDDAERAAMITAVLDLHIGPCPRPEPVNQVARRIPRRHDVIDLNGLGRICAQSLPGGRIHLFGVADDLIDLLHGRKGVRVDLGRAAGHDDPRAGMLAPQAANVLAGLAHGFGGHGTGVHHNRVRESR